MSAAIARLLTDPELARRLTKRSYELPLSATEPEALNAGNSFRSTAHWRQQATI